MSETAPEIHVLDHKVRLLQAADGFRTSLDSVMLAAACPARDGDHVLDLGAGVGGASFCLLWRVKKLRVTGVEIQQSHADLATSNIALNDAGARADFICTDARQYTADERFDHVMCNPPYLEAGTYTPSPSAERAMALGHAPSPPSLATLVSPCLRGDNGGSDPMTLNDWIDAAFRNLKSGGSFTLIHRADFIDKIIQGLGRKFGAIEIIPLYSKAGQDANRVIIRAIKDRKTPAKLHAGLVLHEKDGIYTAAADAILRDGAAIG